MNISKWLLTAVMVLGLNSPTPVHAHGAGAIILLPIYITFTAADYAWLSAKAVPRGFNVDLMNYDYDSANKVALIHRKSDLKYNFYSISLGALNRDIKLCGDNARVALPEEVLRLKSVLGIDRVARFITQPDDKQYLYGISEGETNYFKIDIKTKEVTYYNVPVTDDQTPLVCVHEVDKKEDQAASSL